MTIALTPGTEVHHIKFGKGKIVAYDVDQDAAMVEFERAGRKFVKVSFLDETPRAFPVQNIHTTRKPRKISASPFVYTPPEKIPCREWLYGRHYVRRYLTTTTALSGVGKSGLSLVEALAIVTGRPLLGIVPEGRSKVWVFNGEDPRDEIERQVAAAMLHYKIEPEEVEGLLFIDSGRDLDIKIAVVEKSGTLIMAPVVKEVIETIKSNGIDLVIVDPFVSSHAVSENDNNAIDAVAKTWAKIADECNCAIELVHHSRKTNGSEVTVEDSRGASALIAAARSARVLNTMTEGEKEKCGDAVDNRRLIFRVDNGKASLTVPSDKSDWYLMKSVPLGNGLAGLDDNVIPFGVFEPDYATTHGDYVRVVTKWEWPNAFEDITKIDVAKVQEEYGDAKHKESPQSPDWAGLRIGEILELDMDLKASKEKVKSLLKAWIKNGVFKIVKEKDPARREIKDYVAVGESISAQP